MSELTFEANHIFGLTGSKISQAETELVKLKTYFTIAPVVILKNQIHNTNQVSDNLSDRFLNQSDQSQSLSYGLASFRTLSYPVSHCITGGCSLHPCTVEHSH